MIYVSVDTPATIELGKQGETGVTEIAFDTTKWENEFGPGSVQLSHLRSGSGQPYPVVLRREKGVSVWTVSLPDTEYSGYGSAQLSYLVDGKVKKSCCYNTVVSASLNKPGPVPAPEKAFGDKVAEDAMKAEQARQAIENLSVSAKEGETVAVEKQTQEDGSVNLAFTLPAGGPGGATDHTKLTGRDKPDQHPIGAIKGLSDALAKVPTKTSQLQNDSGYLTEHQDLTDYAKKTDVPTKVSQLTNDAEFVTADKTIQVLEPVTSLEDAQRRGLDNVDKLPVNTRVIYVGLHYKSLKGTLPESLFYPSGPQKIRSLIIDTVGAPNDTFPLIASQILRGSPMAGDRIYPFYFRGYYLGDIPQEWVDLTDKLTQADLQGGIDKALEDAKAKGIFDGFSPTVAVSSTGSGHTVTVTDKDGPKRFQVENGKPGNDGKNAEFTPEIKQEIAGMVIADLPKWTGGAY